MTSKLSVRTLLLSLSLSLTAAPLWAATPASGMVSPASPTLTYTSGPFAVQNTSSTANPNCSAAEPCDDFALTVTVPADYLTTHPYARLFVSTRWPINNFTAYALYLIDSTGAIVDSQLTERDPVAVSAPAQAGTYTLRLVPQQGSPDTLTTTVQLIEDPTGGPAAGLPPRYTQVSSPPGLGNNTAAEMNIGYNAQTQRIMTLGYIQTLRTTFPAQFDPPMPDACEAQWEDVSEPTTTQNTNDPILFTDSQTGRTFVSQLQAGTAGDSIFAYTDDDGDNWTLSTTGTNNGGIDHQSVGSGPYSAGGTAGPSGDYPNAVHYCSQSVGIAFCIRSDDGGDTFTAPSVLKSSADCDGFTPNIHGHVRVTSDGTAYVPDRNCGGQQAVIVSEDSGDSWEVRRIPGTTASDSDSSVAIADNGTLYHCYLASDGRPHVTVSQDKGLSWINDRDVGTRAGIEKAVFTNAIAGDGDRAACAFLGTTLHGNFQSPDFTGLWHAYVAQTYDGGNTWHTVNGTPDDPAQGAGGICLGGTTCIQNRNLLDFNEITLDTQGRPIYGFSDGCLPDANPDLDCLKTGISNRLDFFGVIINTAAKTTLLRQSGGRSLRAAFDRTEPHAPEASCLAGTRDEAASQLGWRVPDAGGASISSYSIYRGTDAATLSLLSSNALEPRYTDEAPDPALSFYYRVTAFNTEGEGIASNLVHLAATHPAVPVAVTPSLNGEARVQVVLHSTFSPGQAKEAGSFQLINPGTTAQQVRALTFSLSQPELLHALRLQSRGVDVTLEHLNSNVLFQFPVVTLAPGEALDFSLTAVAAPAHSAARSRFFNSAYAASTQTGDLRANSVTVLALLLLLAASLPSRLLRSLLLAGGLLLAGCSKQSGSTATPMPPLPEQPEPAPSTTTLDLSAVSASSASEPVHYASLPLRVSVLTRNPN